MKVYIGKYPTDWVALFARKIEKVFGKIGLSEEKQDNFFTWYYGIKWLNKPFLRGTNPRRSLVKIDGHDLWALDATLAIVIHPALVKFKENRNTYAFVDKEDVPEELHSDYDEYGYSAKAWDYVLDQMIFSFEMLADSKKYDEYCGYGAKPFDVHKSIKLEKELNEKIQKGLVLFGKYCRNLWD